MPAAKDPQTDLSDIKDLGYEQARDELASIVTTLENGSATLEESMRLWERGEALATHCRSWLDNATQRVEKLRGEVEKTD
ncbi:exodeoxyribonuclease VII small subunit [Calidifontibacter terrae]